MHVANRSQKNVTLQLFSSVERQVQCIHFPQASKLMHWNQSFFSTPSMISSSYAPKQAAHSFEDISADCKPLSAALTCCLPVLVRFYLSAACFCWSSAFLFFVAPLCLALRFLSSFSSAFFFCSASLFSFSSAFRIFSCSLCCFFSSVTLSLPGPLLFFLFFQ